MRLVGFYPEVILIFVAGGGLGTPRASFHRAP
jgi:hypothetical protein